uniref:Reverse transcriptase domain-containing protein n=1 Tax=Caenorhabditis tropicalis TaxID=1561998 RepID=A0A1I7SXW5_9PELO
MSNWRDYQRENNRQQNGRPAEERQNGNRMSVAKNVSGKMNIYMEYLNRWGRKKFLNCYNERYDQHIPDHVTKMSDFYQAFKNSSEFIALQEECRIYNSNTTDVLQNKATLAKHRREERHRRPDEYEQRRTEHVRNLQEARNRAFIAMPVTLGDVFTK